MADLVVVGDCNPDVMVLTGDVTPAFGQQEQIVPAVSLVVGGSAAITAVAAARLGASVELVAAIGDDAAGQFMLGELRRAGVGTGHVIVRGDLPTGMSVALSRGGDRAILTAPGGIATLAASDIPAELLASARHVHVSSYFLMEERLAPGLPAVFAAARDAGAVTSLDTNWDPSGRWGGTRLREVLAQTDLLLPNEAEALLIAGAPTLDKAVAALTAGGASVAVKRGGDGAVLVTGGVRYQATPPAQQVVDTTGAGDCFNAGLIAALLAGRGPADALALACAAGAGSTRALGGTAGCPTCRRPRPRQEGQRTPPWFGLTRLATLRFMLLTDTDGPNGLDVRVTGYQFPDALDLAKRSSWHMVGGEAHCQEGSWRFHWQALQCDESPRVSAWLAEVAGSITRLRALPGPLRFLEPNLTFRAFPLDAAWYGSWSASTWSFSPRGTGGGRPETPSRCRSPRTKNGCGRRPNNGMPNAPPSRSHRLAASGRRWRATLPPGHPLAERGASCLR